MFRIVTVQPNNLVTYRIQDINGEEIYRSFYGQELQRTLLENLRTEKVFRRDKQKFKEETASQPGVAFVS